MTNLQVINLGLCAINLAEASYPVIDKQFLVEVYVLIAVAVRQCLSDQLRPIAVSIYD